MKKGKHKFLRKAQVLAATRDAHAAPALTTGPLDGDVEVELLTELWSLGLISATTLAMIGRAGNLSAPRPQMAALANLGTRGRWEGNCHRDLSRKLAMSKIDVAPTLEAQVQMLDVKAQPPKKVLAKCPILPPHAFLGYLYRFHRSEFNKHVVGPPGALRQFWEGVPANDPRILGHPCEFLPKDNLVALRIHGDKVPIGKGDSRSVDVKSFSSFTGADGPTWDTRWVMSAIVQQAKFHGDDEDDSTDDAIWKILLWSFRALAAGKWPTKDWNGQPLGEPWSKFSGNLCGEFRFAMFGIAGDLDALCNDLGLQHFNAVPMCCFKCPANRSTLPWSDLRPNAGWMARLYTLADWFFMHKHILFQDGRVGLNLFHVLLDVLHILDLGTCQYILASILYSIAFDFGMVGDLDTKLIALEEHLQRAYTRLNTPAGEQLPHSKFMQIWEGGRRGAPAEFPQLHSKGAVCRHLAPAVKSLLLHINELCPALPNPTLHQEYLFLVDNLCQFYDLIAYEGIVLSEEAAQKCHDSLLAVSVCHQSLCNRARGENRRLFFMTEKAHYVAHMAIDCKRGKLNPRAGWTYADEDFMGRVAQVCNACTRARGPMRVSKAFFQRYRRCLYIRMSRRARTST